MWGLVVEGGMGARERKRETEKGIDNCMMDGTLDFVSSLRHF